MLQTTPTEPTAMARRPDTAGPLAVATPTTRKLADASISVNTRRAYLGALARLDAWRGTAPWRGTHCRGCSMDVLESRHEWRWHWSESVGAPQITGCVFRRPMTWRRRGASRRLRELW